MAKKPYIFRSRDELINRLQSHQTKKMAENFFNERISSLIDIVTKSVDGKTFRAFRNMPHRPSVVFRGWSEKYIKLTIDTLQHINNTEAFSEYVHKASKELCNHWRIIQRSEMGYGRAAKLFNLVLKKLACYEKINNEYRAIFIGLLNVPLDRYTIVGLKDIEPSLRISKNETMHFITNRDEYIKMQNIISVIAKKAGVPAIYYDILAWDMAH